VSKVKLLYGAVDVIEATSNRVIGILRSQVARLEACSRISGPESAAAGSDPTQSLGPSRVRARRLAAAASATGVRVLRAVSVRADPVLEQFVYIPPAVLTRIVHEAEAAPLVGAA
jgi:hypothetical protein